MDSAWPDGQQLTTMQALGMHRTTPVLKSSSRCSPPACPARLSVHAARQGKPAALPCSASAPPSVMQRTEAMAVHGATTTTIEKPGPAEAASATHPTSTSLQHHLAPDPAPSVRELSPANFDQAVTSEGLVLVDFYTVGVAGDSMVASQEVRNTPAGAEHAWFASPASFCVRVGLLWTMQAHACAA